jgi:hypothetical protein
MGAEVVELELPDGTPMLVRAMRVPEDEWESSDAGLGGPSDVGLDGPADVALGRPSFKLVTRTVQGVATELHKALRAAAPDKVTVELGFDLAVKGSALVALVADGGAHATIKVKLEWGAGNQSKDPDDETAGDSADLADDLGEESARQPGEPVGGGAGEC